MLDLCCCVQAFSSCGEWGATICCGAHASHCGGFSLQSTGSRHAGFSSCGSWALELRLGGCGPWASLLRGMWDLPGPGLEPMSPALAGRFLTTAPPGKPSLPSNLPKGEPCGTISVLGWVRQIRKILKEQLVMLLRTRAAWTCICVTQELASRPPSTFCAHPKVTWSPGIRTSSLPQIMAPRRSR